MGHFQGKVWGFIIGGILGILVGVGSLSQIKMSQRDDMLLIYVSVWGIFFALGGLKLGDQMDEEDAKNARIAKQRKANEIQNQEHIAKQRVLDAEKEKVKQAKRNLLIKTLGEIGFEKIRTEFKKEGRYWVCISYWINPVSKYESVIRTYKNRSGNLQTDLNEKPLYVHKETSGGEQPVKTTHEKDMETLIKAVLVTKGEDWKNVKIKFILQSSVKGNHITFEL